MALTIDHLATDQNLRVIQSFEDALGSRMEAGETARIRRMDVDYRTMVCSMELEQDEAIRTIVLHKFGSGADGPRSGNLREFFEVLDLQVRPDHLDCGDRIAPIHEVVPEPLQESDPDWYHKARALELEDRLPEMEELVKKAVPSLHSAIAIAGLYRNRWLRLRQAGETEKASEARQEAVDHAYDFASYATSGGEGAALSLARDEFLKTL